MRSRRFFCFLLVLSFICSGLFSVSAYAKEVDGFEVTTSYSDGTQYIEFEDTIVTEAQQIGTLYMYIDITPTEVIKKDTVFDLDVTFTSSETFDFAIAGLYMYDSSGDYLGVFSDCVCEDGVISCVDVQAPGKVAMFRFIVQAQSPFWTVEEVAGGSAVYLAASDPIPVDNMTRYPELPHPDHNAMIWNTTGGAILCYQTSSDIIWSKTDEYIKFAGSTDSPVYVHKMQGGFWEEYATYTSNQYVGLSTMFDGKPFWTNQDLVGTNVSILKTDNTVLVGDEMSSGNYVFNGVELPMWSSQPVDCPYACLFYLDDIYRVLFSSSPLAYDGTGFFCAQGCLFYNYRFIDGVWELSSSGTNTYQYMFRVSPTWASYDILDETSSSVSSTLYKYDFSVTAVSMTAEENAGLLSGILGWVKNIYNSIVNLPQKIADAIKGFFDNIITALEELGQFLLDGIKGLFVPSEEEVAEIKENWLGLLEDRFGAVYQAGAIISDFASTLQASSAQGIITFPVVEFNFAGAPWSFGGWEVQVVPDGFELAIEALKKIISICCTILFVNGLRKRFENVLGGHKD